MRKSGLPVAQFIAIQRRDNQEWAIPGVSATLNRTFGEGVGRWVVMGSGGDV